MISPTRPIVVGPFIEAIDIVTGSGAGVTTGVGSGAADDAGADAGAALPDAHAVSANAASATQAATRLRPFAGGASLSRDLGIVDLRDGEYVAAERLVRGVQKLVSQVRVGLSEEVVVQAEDVGVLLGVPHGCLVIDVRQHHLADVALALVLRLGVSGAVDAAAGARRDLNQVKAHVVSA